MENQNGDFKKESFQEEIFTLIHQFFYKMKNLALEKLKLQLRTQLAFNFEMKSIL